MRKIRGRPRDSKGRFIQSTKSILELFGPTKTPPINHVHHYAGIKEKGESFAAIVASSREILHLEGVVQLQATP